jgi:biopolymer transport protein TolR
MGMAVGGKKGGFNSEINVTPLADVMLVLLIIVMLIAPMLQAGIVVSLPPASNTFEKADNDEQTTVHVDAAGQFYVDKVLVPNGASGLLSSIQTALSEKLERTVLIKADQEARYSDIMAVFDQMQRVGIENISLITERLGQDALAAEGGE